MIAQARKCLKIPKNEQHFKHKIFCSGESKSSNIFMINLRSQSDQNRMLNNLCNNNTAMYSSDLNLCNDTSCFTCLLALTFD